MSVEDIVESARGTIWSTALRGDRDGYVPPGVVKWPSGQPPIEYLEEGEQPQFMGVSAGRALKVRADDDVELDASSRAPLDKVQQGVMYNGQAGYLSADESYSNILFLTDRRILLIVGKDTESTAIEFRYDDDDVLGFTLDGAVYADGLQYGIRVRIHQQERPQSYNYLHKETPLSIPEAETETETETETTSSEKSDNTVQSSVEIADLISLTPEGFEEYIADIWRAQGYSCKLTKGSGDGGIDIIATQTNDRVLIQAKRYTQQNVGIKTVQRTAGLLVDDEFDASAVKIITASGFTNDARQRAQHISNLELITGSELVSLANETGVEVKNDNGDSAYTQEATTEQVLTTLVPGEPLTTAEVVDELDAPPHSVVGQLKSLLDECKIQAKQVSEDQIIWYKKEE